MNAGRLSARGCALALLGVGASAALIAAVRTSEGAPETRNATTDASAHTPVRAGAITPMGAPQPWSPSQELVAKDGAGGDQFGRALAVSGSWAVIGAPFKTVASNADQGAAYFFLSSAVAPGEDASSGDLWTEMQEVTAGTDAAAGEIFGGAVALSGNFAFIGAPGQGTSNQGEIYIFEERGGVWSQTDAKTAPDAGEDDLFGFAVSASGGVAVVGAPGRAGYQGAAFVYAYTPADDAGGHWVLQQELTEPAGQAFGTAVANVGADLLIAAPGVPGAPAPPSCVTYAFSHSVTGWSRVQALPTTLSSSGVSSVAMAPGLAALPSGAGFEVYVPSNLDGGADGGPWTLQQAVDGGVACPSALVMSPETILAGCPSQALLLTSQSGAAWSLTQTFAQAGTGGVSQTFANSVGLSGATLMIGAPGTSVLGSTLRGAVYVEFPGQISVGQGNGTVCLSGTACGSGNCVGGVCCDQACTGDCQSCATGTCSGCPSGTYCQGTKCASQQTAGSTCAADDACQSGHCAGNVCCEEACSLGCETCATGSCEKVVPGGIGACLPYLCDGTDSTCPTSCSKERDCVRGYYCSATKCVPQQGGSSTCSAPDECLSGVCADGGCQGSTALGSPCTTDEDCVSGVCVQGTCSGTEPVGAHCLTGLQCQSRICSSEVCDQGVCSSNVCVGPSPLGTSCTSSLQCASGLCVDGYCCNEPCDGQCEACDVAPSPGICSPVVGAPHGSGREPCRGAGTPCAGTCQGVGCVYPAATLCNSTCALGIETDYSCNGEGQCEPGAPQSCGNLACADATRCKSSCSTYTDCLFGLRCDVPSGQCLPGGSACIDDGGRSKDVSTPGDAGITDCARYACDPQTGACRTQCTTVTDCSPPNVCDPTDGHCVLPPSTGAAVTSEWGCRQSPAPAPGASIPLLVACIALLRRRRRRGAQNGMLEATQTGSPAPPSPSTPSRRGATPD